MYLAVIIWNFKQYESSSYEIYYLKIINISKEPKNLWITTMSIFKKNITKSLFKKFYSMSILYISVICISVFDVKDIYF